MKVLFIGGTGIISMAITKQLATNPKFELYLLNRGNRNGDLPSNVKIIKGDINNEQEIAEKIKDLSFDVVCNFIAFVPKHLERDFNLFKNKTKQYIFISSASAYQKPLSN
jgi:nucleoside-diphosphate-sugar epimerase